MKEDITENSKPALSQRLKISSPNIVAFGIIFVIACCLSFFGGVAYQKSLKKTSVANGTTNQTAPNANGNGFQGLGRRGNRRGTLGQVTNVNASNITIQDSRTNSTVTFSITSATQITNNGQTAGASDIKTGDTVLVTASSSNAQEAARIILNPPSFMRPGSTNTPSNTPSGNSSI